MPVKQAVLDIRGAQNWNPASLVNYIVRRVGESYCTSSYILKGTSKNANGERLNLRLSYTLENETRAHGGPERLLG